MCVQVVEALGEISTELLDCLLRQFLVKFYNLEEVTACAVLEYNPKVIARLVPVEELQYMPIVLQ